MRISDWSSDVCSSDLRSVRTPSRIDRQLTYPSLVEGGTFDSEKLIAIEAGYRGQQLRDTTLSISLFYNLYDGLRSTELDPVTIFPVRRAEEHTSDLQQLIRITYAVFCLKKKKKTTY